jgi:hypothetical protein
MMMTPVIDTLDIVTESSLIMRSSCPENLANISVKSKTFSRQIKPYCIFRAKGGLLGGQKSFDTLTLNLCRSIQNFLAQLFLKLQNNI